MPLLETIQHQPLLMMTEDIQMLVVMVSPVDRLCEESRFEIVVHFSQNI